MFEGGSRKIEIDENETCMKPTDESDVIASPAYPEEQNPTGIKYDMAKPDYSLVPPNALEDVVKILTLGAQKYDRHNWKLLKGAKQRYFAAAMRHMWAWMRGELTDSESGLSHCAHALCCIMFILELEHLNLDP